MADNRLSSIQSDFNSKSDELFDSDAKGTAD